MTVKESLSLRLFPIALRLLAAGFVVFFGGMVVLWALGGVEPGSLLYPLTRWGHDQIATETMLCAVYVVWGVFLWRAADDPASNRLFIDFTVVANFAHFGAMLVMAIAMGGEHTHLLGDVPLGWVSILPVAALWLPVRSQILRTS